MASFIKLKDGHILNVENIGYMVRWSGYKRAGVSDDYADCRAMVVFGNGTEFLLHPEEERAVEKLLRSSGNQFLTHPDAECVT